MRGRRILWGLLVAGALGLYLFENHTGTRALLVSLAAAPFLLALPLLAARRNGGASLGLPARAARGARLDGTLRLDGLPPGVRAEAVLEARNRLTGERDEMVLRPGARGAAAFSLTAAHSGLIRVRLERLVLRDPLGLFERRLSREAEACVTVPPEVFPLSLRPDAGAASPSGRPRRGVSMEPGEIRPYLPGDPLRRIHWKLSRKTGTLLVREDEAFLPEAERVLLLELAAPLTPPEADALLDLLASLSHALLEEGTPHTVGWHDGRADAYRSLEIRTAADGAALEAELLETQAGADTLSIAASCHRSGALPDGARIAVLAARHARDMALLRAGNRVTVLTVAEADGEAETSGAFVVPVPPGTLRGGALEVAL